MFTLSQTNVLFLFLDQCVCPLSAELRVPGPQEAALTAALSTPSAAAGLAWKIDRLPPLFQSFYLKKKKLQIIQDSYSLQQILFLPGDNNCDDNDENIEAENTEHNDDKQEGEVNSGK